MDMIEKNGKDNGQKTITKRKKEKYCNIKKNTTNKINNESMNKIQKYDYGC